MDSFERISVPDNFLDRLEALEAKVAALLSRDTTALALDEISDDLGVIRAGQFIAGEGDPNDSLGAFTGVVMSGEQVPGSDGNLYNLLGALLGKTQFGMNALTGAAMFGEGNCQLSRTGLTLLGGNPIEFDDGNDYACVGVVPGSGWQILSLNTYVAEAVVNGDFEAGVLTGWTTGGSPAIDNAVFHDGSYSCRIPPMASIVSTSFITLTGGGAYGHPYHAVSFWIRWAGSGSGTLVPFIELYDSGGTLLETVTATGIVNNTAGLWQKYTVLFTKTVSTDAKAKIGFYTGSSGYDAYIDDITMMSSLNAGQLLFAGAADGLGKFILSSGANKVEIKPGSIITASGVVLSAKNFLASGYLATASAFAVAAATYTVAAADSAFWVNYAGTCTVTLPDPATYPGRWLYIKTITANAVNSASSNVRALTNNILGTAILAATAGKWALLQASGTSWYIMAAN